MIIPISVIVTLAVLHRMEGIQRRPGFRGRGYRILEISTLDAVGRDSPPS
ncbi:MAG: hypothetical protein ACLSHC_07225 [Bilophila wadsworthia]